MINQETTRTLETQMRRRREEILDLHDSLQSSRLILQERENEIEEMAGKEIMLDDVDRIDERVIEELKGIDAALAAIQSGRYGRCASCRRPIAVKRLQAIPWASVCKRCAINREAGIDYESEEGPDVPVGDDEIVAALWDVLDQRDDLTVDELRIESIDGTIYLAGNVSTHGEHQRILEIIEEDLGYEDVIDRIGIEASDERLYDPDADETTNEKERVMQGEAVEDDYYVATEENSSVVPPDALVVEDDR